MSDDPKAPEWPVMVSTRGIKFPVGEPLPPVSRPKPADLSAMTADDLHEWARERGIGAAEVHRFVTFDRDGNIEKLREPVGEFDPRYGEDW